jgi:hypothetical protein
LVCDVAAVPISAYPQQGVPMGYVVYVPLLVFISIHATMMFSLI